jgi:hypothetical protein
MRATFIITAVLENGARVGTCKNAVGHRDPSTAELYDRRGDNPENAALFLQRMNFRSLARQE